jgi:hypothetical protein
MLSSTAKHQLRKPRETNLDEKTYSSDVDGLKEAAAELSEQATSNESIPGGKDGKYLAEIPTGDHGDVGAPPAEDDGLSLKEAAKRLSNYRQQRETDRDNLNRAIGLDSDEDLAHEAKRREVEDAMGITELKSSLEDLKQANEKLRAPVSTHQSVWLGRYAVLSRREQHRR